MVIDPDLFENLLLPAHRPSRGADGLARRSAVPIWCRRSAFFLLSGPFFALTAWAGGSSKKSDPVSPNGRFEVRVNKVTDSDGKAADQLGIRDKLTERDHDASQIAYEAPRLEFATKWSPDGLMVLVDSWFSDNSEHNRAGVLRWHHGRFTPQSLPEGASTLGWRGNEKLACNLPIARVIDLSTRPAKPPPDLNLLNSEMQTLREPVETVESVSPDGKFEIVRLLQESPWIQACVLREAKSHRLIQVCFARVRGGDFSWSPDSKYVVFHHEIEGAGVHERPGWFVLKWNGRAFDDVPIGGTDVYGKPKWQRPGRLACSVRSERVLSWNPRRKAFEP